MGDGLEQTWGRMLTCPSCRSENVFVQNGTEIQHRRCLDCQLQWGWGWGVSRSPRFPVPEGAIVVEGCSASYTQSASAPQTVSVPEGWVMVPREPTPGMCSAALTELSGPTDCDPKASAWDAVRAYRAMIASAPTVPEEHNHDS